MAAATLAGVWKRFRGKGPDTVAVQGLDLEIRDNELLVVTGPSGCGKTTLLRLIAGLAAPDSGEIRVRGKRVLTGDTSSKVGMVFQQPALYPRMTGFDNIAFGLKVRRVPRGEIATRVREVASTVGASGLLERLPHQLSGGECQRVGLARALVLQPRLLLLDEPLSNVDAQGRAQLRDDILHLQRRSGLPMVYVTHDQHEAMVMADRLAVMRQGRLEQLGTPAEVYDRATNAFVAAFFGLPPMNLISGAAAQGGVFHVDGPGGAPVAILEVPRGIALRPGRVRLGVRPEHWRINTPSQSNLTIRARVDAVQFAGADLHVKCLCGTQAIVARVPRSGCMELGEECTISAEWSAVRWFADDEGGRALD